MGSSFRLVPVVRVSGHDVVRRALAAILLVAAGLKTHQLATSPVVSEGLLDSRWVLVATVEFELFFGLWLLAGLLPRLTWAAAVGCFGLFACVSLHKALGGAASCGCFGRVEINPWHTFTLDVASVLALLHWQPEGLSQSLRAGGLSQFLLSKNGTVSFTISPKRGTAALGCVESPRTAEGGCPTSGYGNRQSIRSFFSDSSVVLRLSIVGLVWVAVGIPAAVAMGTYKPSLLGSDGVILGDDNLVIIEPEKWVGKRFPLLPFIEDAPVPEGLSPSATADGPVPLAEQDRRPLRQRLAEGRWIVVLYHHDCSECRKAIPKYKKLIRRSAADPTAARVALVEVPPYGDASSWGLSGDCPCVLGRLSEEKEWFVETPCRIVVCAGLVR
ncbi:MAG: hypothetical protein JW818_02170 [Pirellulales bacterium]|nr:hypothetical protein [Pirellulales bacterium]